MSQPRNVGPLCARSGCFHGKDSHASGRVAFCGVGGCECKSFLEDRKTIVLEPVEIRVAPGAALLKRGDEVSPMHYTEEMKATVKASNPKDALGIKRVPASVIPRTVLAELGIALLEGALKYRRHNYRAIGVRASVYFDAANRHMDQFWEGEDVDPESGLSHVTKAIASLTVLRDAMIQEKWIDDRPPKTEDGWLIALNELAAALVERFGAKAKEPYTEKGGAS